MIKVEREKSMSFFDRMKDTFSVAGAEMNQKVSYTTETMKLNNQIRNNNKKIEDLVYQVGKMYVEQHLMEDENECSALFIQIRKYKNENEIFRETIQRLSQECEEETNRRQEKLKEKQEQLERNRKERKEVGESLEFRSKEAVEHEFSEEVNITENINKMTKICNKCSQENDEDALFCIYCGTSLKEE